jgi:hypothetical protein
MTAADDATVITANSAPDEINSFARPLTFWSLPKGAFDLSRDSLGVPERPAIADNRFPGPEDQSQ